MIRGLHAMFYSSDAAATRAFLRDELGLPFTDVGDGWLIFDFAEGEAGCHPLWEEHSKPGMDFSFYCDDVEATVAALREKGVAFKNEIEDRGWGLAIEMIVPGGIEMTLYQPRYKKG